MFAVGACVILESEGHLKAEERQYGNSVQGLPHNLNGLFECIFHP